MVSFEVYLGGLPKFSAKKRRQPAPFKWVIIYNLYCLLSEGITERGSVDPRLSQEIISIEARCVRGQIVASDIIVILKVSDPCSC